ncbi:MAG: hypothetical protein ACRD43_12140 [Pyrinomonadaceae bacterium]
MPPRFVKDSRDRTHYVWHQEMRMSCGPACVAMAEEAYRQQRTENAEARVRQLSQKYPGHFTATTGTTIMNLADVMRVEGIPTYKPVQIPRKTMFSYFHHYCRRRTPIIAQVLWLQPDSITMMTHFTLLKQVDTDNRMIFLDPLHDVVEVHRDQLTEHFHYRSASGSNGELTGWMVIPHLH